MTGRARRQEERDGREGKVEERAIWQGEQDGRDKVGQYRCLNTPIYFPLGGIGPLLNAHPWHFGHKIFLGYSISCSFPL